jgi:hypothetical protein
MGRKNKEGSFCFAGYTAGVLPLISGVYLSVKHWIDPLSPAISLIISLLTSLNGLFLIFIRLVFEMLILHGRSSALRFSFNSALNWLLTAHRDLPKSGNEE